MAHHYHCLDTGRCGDLPLLPLEDFPPPMPSCSDQYTVLDMNNHTGTRNRTYDRERKHDPDSGGSGGWLPRKSTPDSGGSGGWLPKKQFSESSGSGSGCHTLSDRDVASLVHKLKCDVQHLKDFVDTRHQYDTIHDSGGRTYSRVKANNKCNNILQVVDDRGLHNIKHVLDPGIHIYRRCIWMLILFLSLVSAVYHVHAICVRFISFPTHTSVQERELETIKFPAITVCNLNTFRLTDVTSAGLYDLFSHWNGASFDRKDTNTTTPTTHADIINASYSDLLSVFGHKKKDFIHRCKWGRTECSSEDFSAMPLQNGRCFTYYPDPWKSNIRESGQAHGFFLELNVEQYEYLLAATSAVGARVYVHDPAKQPRLYGGCVTVPVGKYTSIKIHRIRHYTLPPPYGSCDSPRAIHSLGLAFGLLPCTEQCADLDSYNRYQARLVQEKCTCKPECMTTEYTMTSSQAAIPSYGVADLTGSLAERRKLEKRFTAARDTYHRIDHVIFHYDSSKLNETLKTLQECVQSSQAFRRNIALYKREYNSASHTIMDAMRHLRKSVKTHFTFFKQSSHVAFAYFQRPLKSSIENVEILYKVITETRNLSKIAILQDLEEIYKIFDDNIDIERNDPTIVPPLSEIASGIRIFKEELVDGYGLYYREFLSANQFYKTKIKTIFHTIHKLSSKLSEGLVLVRNITRKFKQNDPEWLKLMEKHLIRCIEYIKKEHVNLTTELDLLFHEYIQHRRQITEFYRHLSNVTANVNETFESIKSNISEMAKVGLNIDTSLEVLLSETSDVRTRYVRGMFGKTQLVKELLTARSINEWMKIKVRKEH